MTPLVRQQPFPLFIQKSKETEPLDLLHLRIADIYARMGPNPESPRFSDGLRELGVENDPETTRLAADIMGKNASREPLATITKDGSLENGELEGRSGIYFIHDASNVPQYVFKPGTQRTHYEKLIAKVAQSIGLRGRFVSILPCVLQNPPTDTDNKENFRLVGEHWHQRVVYTKNPTFMVGAIQEFLPKPERPLTHLAFAEILLLSLVVGLRDGKINGMEDKLFDGDDSWNHRLDPCITSIEEMCQKGVASTNLPLLKHAFGNLNLSSEDSQALYNIVSNWTPELIGQICEDLQSETVLFIDENVEKAQRRGVDECGTPFLVVKRDEPPHKTTQRGGAVLSSEQISACAKRMERARDYIVQMHEAGAPFSPVDVAGAVDPYFKIYLEELSAVFDRVSPFEVVGQIPPSKLQSNYPFNKEVLKGMFAKMFERAKAMNLVAAKEERKEESKTASTVVKKSEFLPRNKHIEQVRKRHPMPVHHRRLGVVTIPRVKNFLTVSPSLSTLD